MKARFSLQQLHTSQFSGYGIDLLLNCGNLPRLSSQQTPLSGLALFSERQERQLL